MRTASLLLAVTGTTAIACGPAHSHVERTVLIPGTAADVYPLVADLQKFGAWSPWSGRDSSATHHFSSRTRGRNAWVRWEGGVDVASGMVTIMSAQEDRAVTHQMAFLEPWEGEADARFTITAKGDAVEVRWELDQTNDMMGRVMLTFVTMDAILGGSVEQGLDRLKEDVADRRALEAAKQNAGMASPAQKTAP